MSADQGRGETPTLFSRYNKTRKSSHGHFTSGHWKKRFSGGGFLLPSATSGKGIDCSSNVPIPGDINKRSLGMKDVRNENYDAQDAPFLPTTNILDHAARLEAVAAKMESKTIAAGIESDSLNENFSPIRPNTKKKRRFKRMALDPETHHATTSSTISTKDGIGISMPTTVEDINLEKIPSNNNPHRINSNIGSNGGSKKGVKNSQHQTSHDVVLASNNDPLSSNTGTIKRKKVRSRSAGVTNQIPVMQNVKRVYHGAPAHPSLTYCSASSSKVTHLLLPSVPPSVISQPISTVVPGKRKRSSNREKSVENDLTSHVHSHSYYRSRPTCVPSNSEHISDIIFENVLTSNKNRGADEVANLATTETNASIKLNRDSVMMDCDDEGEDGNDRRGAISCSSLSSSDWASDDDLRHDGGQLEQNRIDGNLLIRNVDSDHEADDEQSDWPGHEDTEGGCSRMQGETVFGLTDDELDNVMLDDPNSMTRFKNRAKNVYNPILDNNASTLVASGEDTMDQENLNTLTSTARQTYLARMKRLAECVPGREIRAGSRRVRSRQRGFTIKSSSSEQVSRFLQDSSRSELRLTVLRSSDRNKIAHLANLYSLSMRYEDSPRGVAGSGGNMLVLTKTGRTLKVDQTPFVVPNTPSSSGGGNMSGSATGSNKHHIEVKRRRKSGPLQSSIDSLSTLNLLPGEGVSHLEMTTGATSIPDSSPNLNDRIGLMLETSFNPIIPSAVCLSSSMVAHQGSLPCSGVGIELKECQDDDDLPAKSSSTTSEGENEEDSPLSSPIMELTNIKMETPSTTTSHIGDMMKSTDPVDSACCSNNILLSASFQHKSPL